VPDDNLGGALPLLSARVMPGCREPACPRLSFTQASAQVPARERLTARLRQALAEVIAGSDRAAADVAAEHPVSWHTAYRALVAAAAHWLPEPTPARVLGVDEPRTRTVRWILQQAAGRRVWRRSDPWMTSFVDADPTRAGVLLGLAPGRSGSCVRAWVGEQTRAFCDQVQLGVIDPSAPYASGIRAVLPRRGLRSTSGT
jgi:transposase